jgi:hypothetical protein
MARLWPELMLREQLGPERAEAIKEMGWRSWRK